MAAASLRPEHCDGARPHPRTSCPAPPTLFPAAARHFQDPSRSDSSTCGWSANSTFRGLPSARHVCGALPVKAGEPAPFVFSLSLAPLRRREAPESPAGRGLDL